MGRVIALVARIDDRCAAQIGRGPRAAFAELVFGLAQAFDPEALLRLVDAGMDSGAGGRPSAG